MPVYADTGFNLFLVEAGSVRLPLKYAIMYPFSTLEHLTAPEQD